ncbi:MAG: hypothetical protein CVV42_10220 [Candidatus Riflebacteria bacterium HGW-Riflebacteria-2]|jgi:hypothetical protein|nr:MAG: hypothetical protein CVV42_10220 [Candidatus Riflebacteria bacterium HGW-Riflebacteria-2]
MSSLLSVKRVFYWFLFMLCFVALPGLLIAFGFVYTESQNQQNHLQKHNEVIRRFYQNLQQFASNEAFFCNYLNMTFTPNTFKPNKGLQNTEKHKTKNITRQEIERKLTETKEKFGFDYVLYEHNKGIASTSFVINNPQEWEMAMVLLSKFYISNNSEVSEEIFQAGGKILGPQLNLRHLENSRDPEEPHLVYADSCYKKPMFWTGVISGFQILILIKPESLDSSDGLWNQAEEFSRDSRSLYRFSVAETNSFRHPQIARYLATQVEQAYKQHETGKMSQIETNDLIVFPKFINHKMTLLGYIEKNSLTSGNLTLPAMLTTLVFLMFTLIAGKYSYGLIIGNQPDDLSLRWKLRFLFFFANGLPLIVLFFIGTDYLDQKRDNLLREMHGKGIEFVQDFDEKIEIEYAKAQASKKTAEKGLIEALATQPLSNRIIRDFAGKLSKNAEWKVVLVASQSSVIGTEGGIIDEKRGIFPPGYDRKNDQSLKQREYTSKVGQFFLDKINGTKISDKAATEIEMLLESVTQKPLVNFIFDMLRNRGNFLDWGFGRNIHPSILDTFSLKNSNSADYFFIATIRRSQFQLNFLTSYIQQASRNKLGLKIVAIYGNRLSVPAESFKDPNIRHFASTLTTYPSDEIKFLTFEGVQYLAMGYEGKFIKEYKLIGLYPLENIDKIIDKQRSQLIVFAVLSLLMTLVLSQVLSQSFLVPLQLLTTGAKAIESKNFKHRLPDLGRDEFGSMGGIFNHVMIDLEELSVAGAIQEQLLPQQQIETGGFSLFGRSIAMGELGGDYFDHIQVADDRFSVLLGDVAGHGVGAALIMAMAKAGIIQSDELLEQPLALINRLHNLIYASKTKKQKKVMTFQYLCVNSQTGRGIYSNAGACSPMIIRKSRNEIEELTLAGAALGAFKKANYSEIEIVFEPGDAMVFYTDGIVEARNSSGEEIGFDNLKKLLADSWNEDAETFYNNIYQSYMNHLGNEGAQDDLTMVILVYTGKKQEEPRPAHETV